MLNSQILNQNYVNGLMTATISWSLIGSWYDGLPYYSDGLMTAAQPWSGHYEVNTPIWASAHTTQFTSPGWKYLAHNHGVGKLPKGGSYVGLVSPKGDQLTIVIETMSHDHSLCIRPPLPKYTVKGEKVIITLKGTFAPIAQMNVWYSKFGFDGANTTMFEKKEPLEFKNGQAHLNVEPDEIYTLTTVGEGQKGSYPNPPDPQPFPLPYSDDFEGYSLYQEPNNIAPQIGSFEVLGNSTNQFIRQTVLETPVVWCWADQIKRPHGIIGNSSWSDIHVMVDFKIPDVNGSDGVFVAARTGLGGCQPNTSRGVYLFILQEEYVLSVDIDSIDVLIRGSISYVPGWNKLSLFVQGLEATAVFNGQGLFNTSIPELPAHGWVAIGTTSFGLADFDNLAIAPVREGREKMGQYFHDSQAKPLYFVSEH